MLMYLHVSIIYLMHAYVLHFIFLNEIAYVANFLISFMFFQFMFYLVSI